MGLGNIVHAATQIPGTRSLRSFCASIQARRLRSLIKAYHRKAQEPEIREVLDYLERHPSLPLPLNTVPPCDFMDDFHPEKIEVEDDRESGFPFVIHEGRRVFFPKEYSRAEVQKRVFIAMTEQHPGSPHEYLNAGFMVSPGDVAVMAGASDGIFTLSIIDRLSKAYLFEPDSIWQAPLRLTTRPWADKIEIVQRFLGGQNTAEMTTLDQFMQGKGELNYLQADVEGAEAELLYGGSETLRRSRRVRASICCYHRHEDDINLSAILRQYGMEVSFAHGYFVMGLRPPYLRRGVIHGWKGVVPTAA